ncbi:uncharacterized protein [Nicotiana tomentosiformis]|uniref:uncharacterized protein n=1 Tax=Nicotiana tomentosiformis TaxID=4098 RepID=UPI00051C280A|nr:uncharacterized protein LOC117279764 [Nicotiana tomentosiformis]
MNATNEESVEFASYQLKGVAYTWYETWAREQGENAPLATWKEFSKGFREQFFSDADKYAIATQFKQLKQESMNVKEYSHEFTRLSKYATYMIPNEVARVRRFVDGLRPHIKSHASAATMYPCSFSFVFSHAKRLELWNKQKKADWNLNKKARTTGNYGSSFGGNNSRGISGPTQSVVPSIGSAPFGRQE